MSRLPLRALSKGRFTRASGIHRTQSGSMQGAGPQWRAPQEEREVRDPRSTQTAEEYILHYRKALEVSPEDAEAHYKLGFALDVEGHSREARTHLREAIRLQPDWWRPMEALAWILASSHDGGARDPAEAVRWSRNGVGPIRWTVLG